jgi:type I restriction enzyme S subunit
VVRRAGLSISAIKVSELEGRKRLDAEYYQPHFLEMVKQFEHFKSLTDYKPLILHPTEVKRVYEEEGLQLLFTQNIRDNRLDFSHTDYLPFSVEEQIRKNKLQPGDVVVTRTGANFGDAASYDGTPSPIYASSHCIIIRCKDIPGAYLSTYFNTDVGKALLKHGVYGAAQPEIAPDYIRTLHIPRFGEQAEKNIE